MSAETVDLTVDAIAAGGSGVGRTEAGQVVFVPGTAPGDRLRVELVERRKRWARGRLVELYEAGPGRVEPACSHFGECGGCRLMHLDARSQLESLRDGVRETLLRIGRVEVPVADTISGARRLGYRNRVTFTLRRRSGRVFAGYHALTGRRLVDVETCPIAEPAVAEAWRRLRSAWGGGARHLPPGPEIRITLRASVSGDVAILVTGGRDSTAASDAAARRLAAGVRAIERGVPGLASYWWSPAEGPRRHLFGTETLRDRWLDLDVDLGPEAFLQVNREMAAAIEGHVGEGLRPVAGRRLLDLYAGVGVRGVRAAGAGASVVAVESNVDAVDTGRRLAETAGVAVEFRCGTVEAALRTLPESIDDVVVNPPRAGLSSEAAARVAELPATRLVYVSCDPGTLARDVARLSPGWTPTHAVPFDAFPHTGHVETVLWFRPAGDRA